MQLTVKLSKNKYYHHKSSCKLENMLKDICENIFVCLFSVHNTMGLSRHEQVCLIRLRIERYFSHHQRSISRKKKKYLSKSRRGKYLYKRSLITHTCSWRDKLIVLCWKMLLQLFLFIWLTKFLANKVIQIKCLFYIILWRRLSFSTKYIMLIMISFLRNFRSTMSSHYQNATNCVCTTSFYKNVT